MVSTVVQFVLKEYPLSVGKYYLSIYIVYDRTMKLKADVVKTRDKSMIRETNLVRSKTQSNLIVFVSAGVAVWYTYACVCLCLSPPLHLHLTAGVGMFTHPKHNSSKRD